jgi:hypothetical protein
MLVRSFKAKALATARKLKRRLGKRSAYAPPTIEFTGSRDYWEQRYRIGGNSGAGSYGRLAQFKAEFLNGFVKERSIESIIEFGSGDGAQLALAQYPKYLGIDVSETAIKQCRSVYRNRADLDFKHTSEYRPEMRAELSLSLDVIYHLVEDDTYVAYMKQLFDSASRYVIIYSSNRDEHAVPHVRHREFTAWVKSERADFRLLSFEPNRYPSDPADPHNTSFADFYVYERKAS